MQLSNIKVQVPLFADDIVIVTERKEDMQKNLAVLKAAMEKWEMKMHLGKTKVMVVSGEGEGCNVTIEGGKIEEVQSLKYLGSSISADGSCSRYQIGAVTRAIGAMRKEVLERRELKKATKLWVKVHFGVLNSEPLIVWSLNRVLLWVLPVKHCISLETTRPIISFKEAVNAHTHTQTTTVYWSNYGIVKNDV